MTAKACPWHDKMLPQWCGECGGFVGWHCAMCGESVVEKVIVPGCCRCADGAKEWVDGPYPSYELLLEQAERSGDWTREEITNLMIAQLSVLSGEMQA